MKLGTARNCENGSWRHTQLEAHYAPAYGAARPSLGSISTRSCPPEFSSSEAYGISNDGINIYVSGSGFNTPTGRNEALLWTQAVPEPGTSGLLCLGTILLAMQRRRKVA